MESGAHMDRNTHLRSLAEATAKFFITAAQIKDHGFIEEQECRIVLYACKSKLSADVLKLREGQSWLIPFVEIPLCLKERVKSPLRRIVVGPSAHREEVKHSVELFLQSRGIQVWQPGVNDGVIVETSRIPYRSE
jgi:hypothetical protein